MAKPTISTFPQRRNWDGTFDSICPRCLVTVSKARTEPELQVPESAHHFEGFDLERKLYKTDRQDPEDRSQ